MFFNENVQLFHIDATDSIEAIALAANELYKREIVKKDYLPNVLCREKKFPTGLDTGNVGVALPHTDSQYVNRSQIAFVSLNRPVKFLDMVDRSKEINVRLIFMIAMKRPHEQAKTLSDLVSLFQKQDVMNKFLKVNSSSEFTSILKKENIQ